ncbi:MAG: RIP metalloprotease RseP [Gammaproteobacteria bacterium]
MNILISVVSFIVAVSVIVTVHEFGHFIVARLLGVKVLRFSVGFGRSLLRYVSPKSGVEYVLASIPLGGYVKMLDEREGHVEPHEEQYAFNRQPVGSRFAIAAAGPLFNFIFAVFAYACMYIVGVQGIVPEIGKVEKDSLAYQAGLNEGDVLVQVNQRDVATWEEASIELINEGLKTGIVSISKRNQQQEISQVMLDLSDTKALLDEGSPLEKIGVEPWRMRLDAKLGEFTSGSAAEQQGFKEGDAILSANGEVVLDWAHWVKIVQANPATPIALEVLRNSEQISASLTPASEQVGGLNIGRIGAYPWINQSEREKRQITIREGIVDSIAKGATKTLDMSVLTVKLLGKLLTGQASVKNISGPISIAEYAGISAQLGLATFLSTLAIISISIGILNLMPVPILDGGHLMYYLIEMVKGSPVSEATQLVGQKIGIFMLAGLMSLAFYNDFQRVFS